MKKYKVFYLAKKNSGACSFQCEVEAINEKTAKIHANSQLLVERMCLTDFKKPVVTAVRSIQMQGAVQ